MNNKRVFLMVVILLVLSFMVFAQEVTPVPTPDVTPYEPSLALDPSAVTIYYPDTVLSTTVTYIDYNVKVWNIWTYTIPSWLTASSESGGEGETVNFTVDWSQFEPGETKETHVFFAVSTSAGGRSLNVTATNIFPSPGDVWFVPQESTVSVNENFSLEIHLNSGTQKFSVYKFELLYDSFVIDMDISIGTEGVEIGPYGFMNATGAFEPRIFDGFDIFGTGPGSDLHLFTVHFVTGNAAGSTDIDLIIHELKDNTLTEIGTPRSLGASIIVDTQIALGDVNGDGNINIIDAFMVAKYYIGLDPCEPNVGLDCFFYLDKADVNCDGRVNILDALNIAQYYVGLIEQFCM